MIGSVQGNDSYTRKSSFSQPNIASTAPSFKQRYAEQIAAMQKNVDRCEWGNNNLKDFFNALNQQADGSVELTEEDIQELKQKYDIQNLTDEKKTALLLELNQRNVLSYQDCRNAKMSFVPLPSETLWG